MSRLLDAWGLEKDLKKEVEIKKENILQQQQISNNTNKKAGRPSATIDRTKIVRNVTIKMTDNDFIFSNMLAKEKNKEGLCGADVSSLIAYFIQQSRVANPELSKAADAMYELKAKKNQ